MVIDRYRYIDISVGICVLKSIETSKRGEFYCL